MNEGGQRTRYTDQEDYVRPSYMDRQCAKALERTRRWDTTRCVIDTDGLFGENLQWAKQSGSRVGKICRHIDPLCTRNQSVKLP